MDRQAISRRKDAPLLKWVIDRLRADASNIFATVVRKGVALDPAYERLNQVGTEYTAVLRGNKSAGRRFRSFPSTTYKE